MSKFSPTFYTHQLQPVPRESSKMDPSAKIVSLFPHLISFCLKTLAAQKSRKKRSCGFWRWHWNFFFARSASSMNWCPRGNDKMRCFTCLLRPITNWTFPLDLSHDITTRLCVHTVMLYYLFFDLHSVEAIRKVSDPADTNPIQSLSLSKTLGQAATYWKLNNVICLCIFTFPFDRHMDYGCIQWTWLRHHMLLWVVEMGRQTMTSFSNSLSPVSNESSKQIHWSHYKVWNTQCKIL